MGYPHFTTDCHEHHDVVRDYGDPRRPVELVTLCGSTRFRALFDVETRRLTHEGVIVLGPGVWGHNGDPITTEQKITLDELHLRKIDLADRVHVINLNGYIGDSTRREIEYAVKRGITVSYLESPEPDGE